MWTLRDRRFVNTCPDDDTEVVKILYFGLPGTLCGERHVTGPAGWLASHFPSLSMMVVGEPTYVFWTYEGSYLRALWQWLSGKEVV
jgi:hypothetical protein